MPTMPRSINIVRSSLTGGIKSRRPNHGLRNKVPSEPPRSKARRRIWSAVSGANCPGARFSLRAGFGCGRCGARVDEACGVPGIGGGMAGLDLAGPPNNLPSNERSPIKNYRERRARFDFIPRTKVVHQGPPRYLCGENPRVVLATTQIAWWSKRTTALGTHGRAIATAAEHRSMIGSNAAHGLSQILFANQPP